MTRHRRLGPFVIGSLIVLVLFGLTCLMEWLEAVIVW